MHTRLKKKDINKRFHRNNKDIMIMLPLILLHYTAVASYAKDYEFACEKKIS